MQLLFSLNGCKSLQFTDRLARAPNPLALELETKVHTKVCNHGEGPY